MPMVFTAEDFAEDKNEEKKVKKPVVKEEVELPEFEEEEDTRGSVFNKDDVEDEEVEDDDGEEEEDDDEEELDDEVDPVTGVKKDQVPTPANVDVLAQRLNVAGLPADLQGKTVGELVTLFNTARTLLQTQANKTSTTPEPELEFTEEDFGIGADPQKFQKKLADYADRRNAPLLIELYKIQSDRAYEQATKLPHFNLFHDQILAIAKQAPVNRTADFNFWKSLHDTFVANNVELITKQRTKKAKPKPEPASVTRGNSGNRSVQSRKQPKLSAKERAVARGLGVSEADYLKMRG